MSARRLTLAWIVGAGLASACGGPAALRYDEEVERSPSAAVHSVHGERLVQLMRELDRLRDERLPKALDVEVELERQGREVARVARAMAESATLIATAAPARLDSEERKEFLALADRLRHRSEALAEDAHELTPAQRNDRLAEIDVTCGQGHGRFRIPRGSDDGR